VTPLTDLADAVHAQLTEHLTTVKRSGAAVAVSTGLVAASALPVQAAPVSSGVTRAVAPAAPSSVNALGGVPFASPVALSTAPLTAPATATVTFDATAFKALPAPRPVRPAAPVQLAGSPVGSSRADSGADSGSGSGSSKSGSGSSGSSSKGSSGSSGGGSSAKGSSVLSVAAKYVGTPYVRGGSKPGGFDCSGYTSYVFRQVGISLPRTANAQYGATSRISKSQAKPGDLVFFLDGGRAYHVGIYAGGNQMYDSPKPGKTVQKRAIWSSSAKFGRV